MEPDSVSSFSRGDSSPSAAASLQAEDSPAAAESLDSAQSALSSGTKHGSFSTASAPPSKKRLITAKARPKKLREVLQQQAFAREKAGQSSGASGADSLELEPPSSAPSPPRASPVSSSDSLPVESIACKGMSFEEIMAAAGIDTSAPLPADAPPPAAAQPCEGRTLLSSSRRTPRSAAEKPADCEGEKEAGAAAQRPPSSVADTAASSRPVSALSTAGGNTPLRGESPALTESECPCGALRLPGGSAAAAGARPASADVAGAHAPRTPRGAAQTSFSVAAAAPSAFSPFAAEREQDVQMEDGGSLGGVAEEDAAFVAIPLAARLTSKTVKQRLHGCEEVLRRLQAEPGRAQDTFAACLQQGGVLEKLLRDSNPLVLAKTIDILLAFARAVTGVSSSDADAKSREGDRASSTGQVSQSLCRLSPEHAASLLDLVGLATLQNILPTPRLTAPATELLALLASVHLAALERLLGVLFAANEKLLAEKKGNVALLKGTAMKQASASVQLLLALVEDFGAACVNAAGGLKSFLDKSVGPLCCVSDKKTRGLCAALAAHAVWLAGGSEAAKKLASDAVKNSRAMQAEIATLLSQTFAGRERVPSSRGFLSGARSEQTVGVAERRAADATRGAGSEGREVILAEESDVIKSVCQQGDWVLRATEGKRKKAAGAAEEKGERELPWKIKMQSWQQLEAALHDCLCITKRNPFLSTLISLVHRCLTLEPTLPVVSCCLRVLQHLVRLLLADGEAFSAAASAGSPQQIRVLLPDVAAKLKVNNRQVQGAATSCLAAFLDAFPLDVACADLLPMKEKLGNYRQALLEALNAAIPPEADATDTAALRNAAFWRAVPQLVQAAREGADDGAPGVRTAALDLLAKIGCKREGGREAIGGVLDALQEQKRQQVLKRIAAAAPAAGTPPARGGPSCVPPLAGRIEQIRARRSPAGASAVLQEGDSREGGADGEQKTAPVTRRDDGRKARENGEARTRGDASSSLHRAAPARIAQRRPPQAAPALGAAAAGAAAAPSSAAPSASASSCSSTPFAFSWELPECPVGLEEAESVARRLWSLEGEMLEGLGSASGLERRAACARLAECWRRPCACRVCRVDTRPEKAAESSEDAQEATEADERECLNEGRLRYAIHLILFMRMKLNNFREKSLLVQQSVLVCLSTAIEAIAHAAGAQRRRAQNALPKEESENPLTFLSSFSSPQRTRRMKINEEPDDTGQTLYVHPCLAPLILAPLVDKIGDPRLGNKIQGLCLSLCEIFASPLPVVGTLLEASEGTLALALPSAASSLRLRAEKGEERGRGAAGFHGFSLRKRDERAGSEAAPKSGERTVRANACAAALGGASGRACQALLALLERVVLTCGAEKLSPIKPLVLFARQIIDAQKPSPAQANRSGGMRLMAALFAQLGEKPLHNLLVAHPLPEDLRAAVKRLAQGAGAAKPQLASSSRSSMTPAAFAAGLPALSLAERALQCLSAGASSVSASVSEIAGPGFEAYIHRAREPVSVAPFLTPERLEALQPPQKKSLVGAEKKSLPKRGEKEELEALKECIRVIAVEGRGCIKAEGLSSLIPILRAKVLDARPPVARLALVLVAAVCDGLTNSPLTPEGASASASAKQSEANDADATMSEDEPEKTGKGHAVSSRGCRLYKDILLPALFERLHGNDRKTVELAHIATLKWMQAIGPEDAALLLLPCLERALAASVSPSRAASFSGSEAASSPRPFGSAASSFSSLRSFKSQGSLESVLSSASGHAQAEKSSPRRVAEALVALLVASRFAFGLTEGTSEHYAERLSRRLLPLLFSLLRESTGARDRAAPVAREEAKREGFAELLETFIARVSRILVSAADLAAVAEERQKHQAWKDALENGSAASEGKEAADRVPPLAARQTESRRSEKVADQGAPRDGLEVNMEEAENPREKERREGVARAPRGRERSAESDAEALDDAPSLPPSSSWASESARSDSDGDEAARGARVDSEAEPPDSVFFHIRRATGLAARRRSGAVTSAAGSPARRTASPPSPQVGDLGAQSSPLSPTPGKPRGGGAPRAGAASPSLLVASEKTAVRGKAAALLAAREEARAAWRPHLSEHLLELMFPSLGASAPLLGASREGLGSPRNAARREGPRSAGSPGSPRAQAVPRALLHAARAAADLWLAFLREASTEGDSGAEKSRAKVLRKLKGEENIISLLINWIADHVAENSLTFPYGMLPPALAASSPVMAPSAAPPSLQPPPAALSASAPGSSSPTCPPSSSAEGGALRECRYTVAAPLVVLGVLLQALHALRVRLSLSEQQTVAALLLDLRSHAALYEVLQGKKAAQRVEKKAEDGKLSSAAFLQERHQQTLRELLGLLARVAAEPASLVCALHKQLSKTKNRNLSCDLLEATCVALGQHLRLPQPFAMSVREKVEKPATSSLSSLSSLSSFSAPCPVSSSFSAHAAAHAQFTEFLLAQMAPRLCQILAAEERLEGKKEGRRLRDLALDTLVFVNAACKGALLNTSSPHLTPELRTWLAEAAKGPLPSISSGRGCSPGLGAAESPACFPLPPHARCADYAFAVFVPFSPVEKAARREERPRDAASAPAPETPAGTSERAQQIKGADPKPANTGKEPASAARKVASAPTASSAAVLEKTAQSQEETVEKIEFRDPELQKLIQERREEHRALLEAMRETDLRTAALRSGAIFEPVLAQVSEARAAAELCFTSLQKELDRSTPALGWLRAQQLKADEAQATCAFLPAAPSPSGSASAASAASRFAANGSVLLASSSSSSSALSSSSLLQPARRAVSAGAGLSASQLLVGAAVSMVKIWSSQLREKDVARLARAAHCLIYLMTTVPLDACALESLSGLAASASPGSRHSSAPASAGGAACASPPCESRQDSGELFAPVAPAAAHSAELPPLSKCVTRLLNSRTTTSTSRGAPGEDSSAASHSAASLSREGDAALFADASCLASSILFEGLLHGLENIFQPHCFDGATAVAVTSFHTILSLLLLLDIVLRRLLAAAKGGGDAEGAPTRRPVLEGPPWRALEGLGATTSQAEPGSEAGEGRMSGGDEHGSEQLLGPETVARACKQLLLCMSRYQAFVYKAAAPAAEELLLPRLLITALLNQCLGKDMLRGSFLSLVRLVDFVFSLAAQQIQGQHSDLNADTAWRFLSKIHRRISSKLEEATKTDESGKRPTRIPRSQLLRLVHTVISSWWIVEGSYEAARLSLQQREQKRAKSEEDKRDRSSRGERPPGTRPAPASGFAGFLDKQWCLAFVYFRLFMHTLVRFSPEALGEYLELQGLSATSPQGQRLDRLLSSSAPFCEAAAESPLAFAPLEAAVKGAAEARNALRTFSCSACIDLARRLETREKPHTPDAEASRDTRGERRDWVMEDRGEQEEGERRKRTLSRERAEALGEPEPSRERKERRRDDDRKEKRHCFGDDVKTVVAEVVEAEHAKLTQLMKRHRIAPLQDPLVSASGDEEAEMASLRRRRSRGHDAFCMVAQQPFDTADDLSLQPYLTDIRARLCRAQVLMEEEAASRSLSEEASPRGTRSERDLLLSFLTRSVALLDVFPLASASRAAAGGDGASGCALVFPTTRRWVDLEALAKLFKVEAGQPARRGEQARVAAGTERRPIADARHAQPPPPDDDGRSQAGSGTDRRRLRGSRPNAEASACEQLPAGPERLVRRDQRHEQQGGHLTLACDTCPLKGGGARHAARGPGGDSDPGSRSREWSHVSARGRDAAARRQEPAPPEGEAESRGRVGRTHAGPGRTHAEGGEATIGTRERAERPTTVEPRRRAAEGPQTSGACTLPSADSSVVLFPASNSLLQRDDASLPGASRAATASSAARHAGERPQQQDQRRGCADACSESVPRGVVEGADKHPFPREPAQAEKKTCLRRSERSPMRLSPQEASLDTASSSMSPTQGAGGQNCGYYME